MTRSGLYVAFAISLWHIVVDELIQEAKRGKEKKKQAQTKATP